jgi:hypothetical protein
LAPRSRLELTTHPKVVPIQEKKYQLIAKDTKAKPIILGIGGERIAIDWFSRISKLPPETCDQPSAVLSLKNDKSRQKSGQIKPKN